jgi:hypothetical protein
MRTVNAVLERGEERHYDFLVRPSDTLITQNDGSKLGPQRLAWDTARSYYLAPAPKAE